MATLRCHGNRVHDIVFDSLESKLWISLSFRLPYSPGSYSLVFHIRLVLILAFNWFHLICIAGFLTLRICPVAIVRLSTLRASTE